MTDFYLFNLNIEYQDTPFNEELWDERILRKFLKDYAKSGSYYLHHRLCVYDKDDLKQYKRMLDNYGHDDGDWDCEQSLLTACDELAALLLMRFSPISFTKLTEAEALELVASSGTTYLAEVGEPEPLFVKANVVLNRTRWLGA